MTTSQWLVGKYLFESVVLLFRGRDAVNDAAYMNVIVCSDGADEFFETTEGCGRFRFFRRFMLVNHSVEDIASDLVEISRSTSILFRFDKNAAVISGHARILNEIDIERHDDSNLMCDDDERRVIWIGRSGKASIE